MYMDRLSAAQVMALPKSTVVVLPVASIEQHGPHLPVGTDSMIGQGIVDLLEKESPGTLLVLPMLKFGVSEHHMHFGGTLTLTHETFKTAVLEIIGSMHRHGFRRFLITNSHGGNCAVGGVIGQKASIDWPDADVLFASWFQLAAVKLKPLVEGAYPSVGHACEFETSVMLVLHPELVDMKKAKDDGPASDQPPFRGDLFGGSSAAWARPFHKMTKRGVFGRPTLATIEKGRKILDLTIGEYKHMLEVAWPGTIRSAAGLSKPRKSRK
jgi:creatinine amidohydrolase